MEMREGVHIEGEWRAHTGYILGTICGCNLAQIGVKV